MALTKGFITIATGKEQYYEIARNLLRSYRFSTKNPLPFAILCDEENEYTKEFDDVRVYPNPTRSYLDKLEMFDYLPYDINIFIDADCLVFKDINKLFDIFESSDDFCCYGRVLDLDNTTGWFEYKNLNDDLKKQVDYVVGLHGGIYYMRRTDKTKKVFDTAKEFTKNYADYKFKGNFQSPGDEPVIALSMAVNKVKPLVHAFPSILCWWEHENRFKLDISKGIAFCKNNEIDTDIVHWGTRFTRSLPYKKQIYSLERSLFGEATFTITFEDKMEDVKMHWSRIATLPRRAFNKLKRTIKNK